MRHFFFPTLVLLCAAGCSRSPDIFQPPIQRKPLLGPEAHLSPVVSMSDPTVDAYIVRDISRTTEVGSWRWAYRHPKMRFYLRGVDKLKFVLDARLAENTFAETGPVTLSILINEQAFDKVVFDKPGDRHIEKPVPPAMLVSHSENFVSFETDKQWVSKEDGAVLSFVLTRAGFVKQ